MTAYKQRLHVMHPNDERQLQALYRDWAQALNAGKPARTIAAITAAIAELQQAIPLMNQKVAA